MQANFNKLEKRLSTKDALTGQENEQDTVINSDVKKHGPAQTEVKHHERIDSEEQGVERELDQEGIIKELSYSDEDSDHDLQVYMV